MSPLLTRYDLDHIKPSDRQARRVVRTLENSSKPALPRKGHRYRRSFV